MAEGMNSIEKKRAQRFLYLKCLYERANGSTVPYFVFTDIGRELGWDDSVSSDVTDYLQDKGLIETPSTSTVSLSTQGIELVEQALSAPEQSTPYFPPAKIIIVVNGNFMVRGDVIGRDKTVGNATG